MYDDKRSDGTNKKGSDRKYVQAIGEKRYQWMC